MPTNLSKSELATVLSALDGQTRNPSNHDKALAALERRAAALGLTIDEILDAAPGLLDGRLSPADWLAEITDAESAEAETETAEPVDEADADAAKPAPRTNTKQATLIAMLRRAEGADLDEIAEATGWRKHTIRGAISGALKKKLGLQVTSTKDHQGRRVYRLPA
jgi:hypothetical protein